MADQSDSYHHPLPPAPNDQQQSYPQQHQGAQQQQQHHQATPQYYHPAVASQQRPPVSPQQYPQGQQNPQDQYLQPTRPQPAHHRNSQSSKSRTFSFQSQKSQKSHKSSGSKENALHETHEEKEARRLHTKADPSVAISEDEPSVVAMTQSSLAPLRSISHKDTSGNPISDPDKSNPTRSRWERPLDTIRSFEAAIDGGYSRKSLYRSETDSVAGWNRRSSFNPTPQPRFQRDSYYSQRPVSFRPDMGGYDGAGPSARNSYYDPQAGYGVPQSQGPYNQQGSYPPQGPYNNGPRRISRMQTEPHYQNYGREQNIYPMPHKDRSYETVTSAAASGNSDHAGYQTDPTSSDNSSIERQSPAKRPEQPPNDYGIGFSQNQAYQNQNFTVGGPNGGPSSRHPLPPTPGGPMQQQPPPAVPRKDVPSVLRRQASEQNPEKRKSWFSRRFSKNA